MSATCDTCRFWSEDDDPEAERMGCCLLNGPGAPSAWTLPSYGCGEHQPKEPEA